MADRKTSHDRILRRRFLQAGAASLAAPIIARSQIGAALAQSPHPLAGTITVAFTTESKTLDPAKYGTGPDIYFLSQMYEMLIRPDPNMKRVNWLAESWSIGEEDGKPVVDVNLRRGVKFHNGYPLTASDMEFSYQRAKDPKISRWAYMQFSVERFEVVDDHHFKIHFKEGDAEYIAENLTLWATSKRYYDEVGEAEFGRKPVGTGPFKFVSWQIGSELRLEANEDYWNTELRPNFKNLTIKVIPEDTTRMAAFTTGAVDWIDNVPLQALPTVKALPGVKSVTVPDGADLSILVNTVDPKLPFADQRVRQAMAHAIDWPTIIKEILFGQGIPYTGLGPYDFGYDASIKGYDFDPEKARQLLKEAGYPNGFQTTCYNLVTPREANMKEVGEAAIAYLEAVGIRCDVRGLEYDAWVSMARRARAPGQPDMDGLLMFLWGIGVPGDPSAPWFGFMHSYVPNTGYGQYSYTNDHEMDALLEEQNRVMDPEKRIALVRKIAKIKEERLLGGIPTYQPLTTFAWHGDKVDFTPWPWTGKWHEMIGIRLKQ
jgi:peptide/nickel transport system substrate-binding protein